MRTFIIMAVSCGCLAVAGKGWAGSTTITLNSSMPPEVGVVLSDGSGSSWPNRYGCGLGDFNGDGIEDFAVSDCADSTQRGAYVVYGHAGPWSSFGLSAIKTNSALGFFVTTPDTTPGFLVEGIGDWNGDGRPDLLLGSINDGAYIIFGSTGTPGNLNTTSFNSSNVRGIRIGPINGTAGILTGAGDFNGDGLADICVPHKLGFNGEYEELVVFGRSGAQANINLDTFSTSDSSGFRVLNNSNAVARGVGDVNNDGFDDLMLNKNQLFYGHAAGHADILGSSSAAKTMMSNSCFDLYAEYQDYDLNGDGLADLVSSNCKPTRVVYGKVNWGASLDLSTLTAPADGYTITGLNTPSPNKTNEPAGDFNGDGYPDFMLARDFTYIIYGGPAAARTRFDLGSLDDTRGVALQVPSNELRESFVGVGDVNADGFDDVFLETTSAGSNSGYLVFGRAAGSGVAGWEVY